MLKTMRTVMAMGAAAMLICGGAYAAQDASGEQPLNEAATAAALATPSQETRAQVEAEAAQDLPVSGTAPLEEVAEEAALETPSQTTRAAVEAEAAENPPASGQKRR